MVLSRILRAGEGKILRQLKAIADAVNDEEAAVKALSDAELRAKTDEFKARIADGADTDSLLVEAFAISGAVFYLFLILSIQAFVKRQRSR